MKEIDQTAPQEYYDSVTGKLLFTAPIGRSFEEFKKESMAHGWPSFRDEEVNWENMRVLADGEAVSVDGTHLGHNLPDGKGNRYVASDEASRRRVATQCLCRSEAFRYHDVVANSLHE